MTSSRVLVIDNERDTCKRLAITLERMHFEVDLADNIEQSRSFLSSHQYRLCLASTQLTDGSGRDVMAAVTSQSPQIPVIMMTADGKVEDTVAALKAGAFDVVAKPVDIKMLKSVVSKAQEQSELPVEPVSANKSRNSGRRKTPQLIGNSQAMSGLRTMIGKLARSQAPVFISGESGVGKEVVARLLHAGSSRASGPFIPVNCGAIPAELMESELFGYSQGSFTGATRDRKGLFQHAHGGTLFLDEVVELPLPMQVKLLRVIQESAIRPIGASKEVPVDTRILSATHKNLASLVAQGHFRQDLFYRLNVIELNVPSLRKHSEDIPVLCKHFLERYAHDNAVPVPGLSKSAMAVLCAHDFPGNVRELENILVRAATLCETDTIYAENLKLIPSKLPMGATVFGGASTQSLDEYMAKMESRAILAALEQTRFNKTQAAKKLGITFRSLRYRLKKLNID